jgi:hypothetical protein
MIVAPPRFGTRPRGSAGPAVYNFRAFSGPDIRMEAERINAIANRLADLARREAELRRYL